MLGIRRKAAAPSARWSAGSICYPSTCKTQAELGREGGLKTAERGPDYFRKIAAMRKTRAGERPRKQPE
jgi:hypothetical protein